ncbi:hypothetical protein AWC27_28100 [Mycobacterium szulgai]|uniref:Uncharacterized protein n=1 Tax=Mycobacterium szulgai TaxID=1787 RepID=A0A1X2EIM0_MYCSZ|nr:hypothetical protein AWC27_28100 [Mycobacterium szulgai]
MYGDSADVVAAHLELAGVQRGTHLDAERLHRVADANAQRIARCGPSEHRQSVIEMPSRRIEVPSRRVPKCRPAIDTPIQQEFTTAALSA